jgi:hypothetical protein
MRRRRAAMTLALLVIMAAPGCRQSNRRAGDVDPSTVGRDMRSYPRGVTIPAAGFGVDLVKWNGPTAGGTRDVDAIPAATTTGQ